MTTTQQQLAGLAGLVLLGIYSWIMMATNGTAAYAWIILIVAITLLVATARRRAGGRHEADRG